MARIVHQEQADDDLGVLHPDAQLKINGQTITVREYGFVESLKLRPVMRSFLDGLYQVMSEQDGELSVEDVLDLIAANIDEVMQLVSAATGLSTDAISQLPENEGENLLLTWWGTNGPFFVRQLQRRHLSNRVSQRKKSTNSDGETSTQR